MVYESFDKDLAVRATRADKSINGGAINSKTIPKY